MKKHILLAATIILLWTTTAFSAHLQGLRGGDVLLNANRKGLELTMYITPAYGWAEPVSVYSPQGMLVKRFTPTWSGTSLHKINIPEHGIYRIHLNRNYVCDIASNSGQLLYAPLPFETSLQHNTPATMYFNVPSSTRDITLHLDNRRGLQGHDVIAKVIPPVGSDKPIILQKQGFTATDILHELQISSDNEQQALSELSPTTLPSAFIPASSTVSDPQSGVWRVDFISGKKGFWIDGSTNLLASAPDQFFPADAIDKPLQVVLTRANPIASPFLGAVGNFGHRGTYGSFLTSYGVEADKLFLSGEPNTQTIIQQSSPEFSKHTLLVLRSMPDDIRSLPMPSRAAEWAEWAAHEVRTFVDNAGISEKDITIQPFNEPNLEMDLDDYLTYMKHFIAECKSNPKLQNIPIGGPALGSADADTVIDWKWIEGLLEQCGDDISTVIWNCYKVPRPEDTFIIGDALKKTREIIKAKGGDQNIIIGAINRQGGLAPNNLFTGRESGLWWAGTLLHAIQTNTASGIYYFKTVDTGIRTKGLFTADGTPKAQAYVQQAVADVLSYPNVSAIQTGHPLVLALAGNNATDGKLFVVNLSWLPVDIDTGKIGVVTGGTDVLTNSKLNTKQLPPKSCTLITFTTGSD